MSKLHYFRNKFSKMAQRPLTFDIGDLKLGDWPKGFSNWLWRNRTSKIWKYELWRLYSDVIVIT